MVNTAQLAQFLGVDNDDAFETNAKAAIASLENYLGYPLCGTTAAETRIFPFNSRELWHKVDPFYDLTSVTIGDETVTDYQLSQNGNLNGAWFNTIRRCSRCVAPYLGYQDCETITIVARFGFAAPTTSEGVDYCTLPDDLFKVLAELTTQVSDPEWNLQSENVRTKSYSKFAPSDAFTRFAHDLAKYRSQRLFA